MDEAGAPMQDMRGHEAETNAKYFMKKHCANVVKIKDDAGKVVKDENDNDKIDFEESKLHKPTR